MVDLTLSAEQEMLRETARAFAANEIRPAVEAVERKQASAVAVARDLVKKGAGLGFLSLLVPEAYGGLGRPCIDMALLCEELAIGDLGVAADLFSLTATMTQLVAMGGTDEQKRKFLGPIGRGESVILSGALSEPSIAGSDLFFPGGDPAIGVRTQARLQGDRYLLQGAKSAFVTNAGVADWYFVLARTDLTRPLAETLTIFAVPAGAPGLSFSQNTELIGWEATHHAQLFLDSVEVPVEHRIGEEGGAMRLFGSCSYMPVCLAACFVGHSRAAFEYAKHYAQERQSWGAPLIRHQAVALKLSDMFAQTHLARLGVWDAAIAADADPFAAATLKAPLAKTAAVDAAIHNAQKAVEILGAYGITREYRAGRMLTDAWVGYACDFTRDMLRLGMVPFV